MPELASIIITVKGRVQGIGFRYSTLRYANKLGLTGYARNLPSGNEVEVKAEGERVQLEKLVEYLNAGPLGAKVERVDLAWSGYGNSYPDFSIRR